MIRVTKPGGKVITTCPDWSSFTSTVLPNWVEGLIKLAMEQLIGTEAYSYSKSSKTHFLNKGLAPVKLI